MKSDEQYLHARFASTLKHPGVVSWVAMFIGEMDTLALARERYAATYHVVRAEWGANANPHIHRNIISKAFPITYILFRTISLKKLKGLSARLAARTGAVTGHVPKLGRDAAACGVAVLSARLHRAHRKRVHKLERRFHQGRQSHI